MNIRLKPRVLMGVLLPLVMAIFFVLLVSSTLRLLEVSQHMRLEAPHNMLWVTSQAQVAGLKLEVVLGDYAAGKPQSTALRHARNVFLSRMRLFRQGPQYRQLKAMGFEKSLETLLAALPRFNSDYETLLQGDRRHIDRLRQWLRDSNVLLGKMATTAMTTEWENLGGKLEDERVELRNIIISLVVILAAGAALALYLTLTLFLSRRQALLLRREKAFSELVISSSEESIIVIDNNRCCSVWNRASEQMFQRDASTLLGCELEAVCDFFKGPLVATTIDQALQGKVETINQLHFQQKIFAVRSVPLRQEADIIGAILMVFDVTELRTAEHEIARHRDHLEELVRDRTQALDAALERERLSSELYRNFGAMLSHQFRTPLAIADSSLQRLIRRKERVTAAEVEERGIRARNALKQLTELITSTLDAARLDAGQVEARKQPVNLFELTNKVCTQQREVATDRTIVLSQRRPANSYVVGDATHLEHILVNLLSNAIKYSPANTPIEVTLDEQEHYLECAVTNQGKFGADPQSVFNRYYRGSNMAGVTGIGLGLYMAKMLARLQGGDVRLKTHDLRVCFVLSLPKDAYVGVGTQEGTA